MYSPPVKFTVKILSLFFVVIFLTQSQVYAGGPLMVNPSNGNPLSWDLPIPIHPETGPCSSYSNQEIIELVESNLNIYEDINDINLEFTLIQGVVRADIDINNFDDFLFNPSNNLAPIQDQINPLAFDNDGSIVREVFGPTAEFTILGFAGPDFVDGDRIIEGQAVFNCRCVLQDCSIENPDSGEEIDLSSTEVDFVATMMHELGHLIGLDHTGLNGNYFDDCLDSGENCNLIPLMYPVSFPRNDTNSLLHRDDEIAALSLYGRSGWDDPLCTIEGSINDANGDVIRCAEVHMIAANPLFSSSSAIGMLVQFDDRNLDGAPGYTGECTENCGRFVLRGLDPNQNYTLRIEPIRSDFVNGSSVGPCRDFLPAGIQGVELLKIPRCLSTQTTTLSFETEFDVPEPTTDEISSSTSESTSASTQSNCGIDQDFSSCNSLSGCHLNPNSSYQFFHFLIFFLSIATSLLTMISARKLNR